MMESSEEKTKDYSLNLEDDPEYPNSFYLTSRYMLVMKTNNLLAKIGEEIQALHHAVVEIYTTHFPELEKLVVSPLSYLKLVMRIQNETVR